MIAMSFDTWQPRMLETAAAIAASAMRWLMNSCTQLIRFVRQVDDSGEEACAVGIH